MGTKQLLEHVESVISGKEPETWLINAINGASAKADILSNYEISDLETVYFELYDWLKVNTGRLRLNNAVDNLAADLIASGRAPRVKAFLNTGTGFSRTYEHLWHK